MNSVLQKRTHLRFKDEFLELLRYSCVTVCYVIAFYTLCKREKEGERMKKRERERLFSHLNVLTIGNL